MLLKNAQLKCMVNVNMNVEVVYATPKQQVLLSLQLVAPCSVQQAIMQSGILQQCPAIDLDQNTVGIFSKRVELTDLVKDGDRVEIYRPLIIDPKQARRLRAARKK